MNLPRCCADKVLVVTYVVGALGTLLIMAVLVSFMHRYTRPEPLAHHLGVHARGDAQHAEQVRQAVGVERLAVLTANTLGAVGCDRCRIGVYWIMPTGRTVALDLPGRARCVILPVATDGRVCTVHRSPSCRVRL